jgi:hypothetical protein
MGFAGIRTEPFLLGIVFDRDSAHPIKVEAYSLTFCINQLALQIFTFRGAKELDGTRVSIKRWGDWHTAAIDIWPTPKNVTWPPTRTIGQDSIGFFEADGLRR